MAEGYNIYSGLSREGIDYTTLVGHVAAGVGQVAVAQANSTVRYYGIRAESAAGVESSPVVIRVERDAAGAVVYARPNALADARAVAAAARKVTVRGVYRRTGEHAAAQAVEVQVAQLDADGSPDWAGALGTITIGVDGIFSETFTDVFADGATVRLAARASTGGASPVYGEQYILRPVVADTTAPDEVDLVLAEQHA